MRDFRTLRLILLCFVVVSGVLAASAQAAAYHPEPLFPLPESLQPAVGFWKRVYLEVTTQAGFLHDSQRLDVVYEIVRFGPKAGERERERHVRARRAHWRQALERLASGSKPRDEDEAAVLASIEKALGRKPTGSDFRVFSRRIRFQLGQRDKFRDGLIRSGAWEKEMRAAFRQRGLPEDLAYLPHVESSFNLKAYSKYGAAGIWQFIRSTGQRYLQIDYVVDERLDPMASTIAAAKLLKENHDSLKTWPLAITAYNHGRTGVRRAVRVLGTRDIGRIVERYRSRTFAFASRNFYAQFLAARQILHAHESYFGQLDRQEPEVVDQIVLPFYVDVRTLDQQLGVAPEVIHHYNPALRPPVYRHRKRIPKGYRLRLPAGTVGPAPAQWLARVPKELQHREQERLRYYQVRRGDTLSKIAKSQGTTAGAIAALNNLPSRHRIYAGQVLDLPEPGSRQSSRSLVREAHAHTKPSPAQIEPAASPPPPLPEDSIWRRVDGSFVVVDSAETLAHFADWLKVSTDRLRKLNGLSRGRALHMGQRLQLDFSRVPEQDFFQRRLEFHKGIEEDFFGSFRVAGTVEHRVRRGESLWALAHQIYRVPPWLIHRYNPDVNLSDLHPGAQLRIPVVEPLAKS